MKASAIIARLTSPRAWGRAVLNALPKLLKVAGLIIGALYCVPAIVGYIFSQKKKGYDRAVLYFMFVFGSISFQAAAMSSAEFLSRASLVDLPEDWSGATRGLIAELAVFFAVVALQELRKLTPFFEKRFRDVTFGRFATVGLFICAAFFYQSTWARDGSPTDLMKEFVAQIGEMTSDEQERFNTLFEG